MTCPVNRLLHRFRLRCPARHDCTREQSSEYDKQHLKQAGRIRRQAQAWWRIYRQELYVDDEAKPFAIVEWQHTLSRIGIVQIFAPPE